MATSTDNSRERSQECSKIIKSEEPESEHSEKWPAVKSFDIQCATKEHVAIICSVNTTEDVGHLINEYFDLKSMTKKGLLS